MNMRRALLQRMEKSTPVETRRASSAVVGARAGKTRSEGVLGQKKICG
jgi:hypothetical protein